MLVFPVWEKYVPAPHVLSRVTLQSLVLSNDVWSCLEVLGLMSTFSFDVPPFSSEQSLDFSWKLLDEIPLKTAVTTINTTTPHSYLVSPLLHSSSRIYSVLIVSFTTHQGNYSVRYIRGSSLVCFRQGRVRFSCPVSPLLNQVNLGEWAGVMRCLSLSP